MNKRYGCMLALSAYVMSLFAAGAHAQGVRRGNVLVPESGIERAGDIGIRAHTHIQILAAPPNRNAGFLAGLGPNGGLTPAQVRQAYSLPSTGGSQIIAIVDAYHNPNALSDFNKFSTYFGLPTETSTNATSSTNKVFQVLYASGKQPAVDSTGGWEMEEALDIEWAHAMAPNAKILLVEASSSSFSSLLSAVDAAGSYTDGNGLTVKEISNSWGGSEYSGENQSDYHFAGLSAVTFFAAGDSGAGAEYPSASPYVVSAGGTTLNTNSSGTFTTETGWSGSGGGPSGYEPRPSYQSGIASYTGAYRGTPDLSFVADPNTGVSVYDSYPYSGVSYTWVVVGGTSASAPSLAGIANLSATAKGVFPNGTEALLANIYANLGTTKFRDITTGNNGYSARAGWDFVTGVGTCLGLTGLQASGSTNPGGPTVTSLSPGSATAGGPAFTLTVTGTGFVNGSTVAWQGTAVTTTFVSATELTAAIPASDIAAAGSATVTVVNPGAVSSGGATFTIVSPPSSTPVLTSISPNSARHGSNTLTMTLTGSQFTSSCLVLWNVGNVTYSLPVQFVSSTQMLALVPWQLLYYSGTAYVYVYNPTLRSGLSGYQTFTIK